MTAAVQPHPIQASCSVEEARALTDQIKGSAERLDALLVTAHERRVWLALGYGSWQSYLTAEFRVSRSRSYQLITQATVVREIAAAAELSTPVDIPEATARDLKPVLAEVVEQVREAVADLAEPERPAAVAEVVDRVREQVITDRRAAEQSETPGGEAPRVASPPGPDDDWSPSSALDKIPARPKGKRPAPRPPSVEEDFADAARELQRAVNRVERLTGDGRFGVRAHKLNAKHRAGIENAAEGLNIVLIRMRELAARAAS
ncbi:MAG: hypothetical protein JWP11_2817 [Frankiales bacterium]|nr:hypothetical protein [Frankiales bacterium]